VHAPATGGGDLGRKGTEDGIDPVDAGERCLHHRAAPVGEFLPIAGGQMPREGAANIDANGGTAEGLGEGRGEWGSGPSQIVEA